MSRGAAASEMVAYVAARSAACGQQRALDDDRHGRGDRGDDQRCAGEHRRNLRGVRAACPDQRDRGTPLVGRQRQHLDDRVEADQAVDDRDRAQQRGQDTQELGVARGDTADRRRREAGSGERCCDVRPRCPVRQLDDRRATAGIADARPRLDVGDSPVVVERANDADHAEARLAAVRELGDERRAGLQADSGCQALADLGFARPGGTATGRELWGLEPSRSPQ